MLKYLWTLLLLLPLDGIAKSPIGFKKWQIDDTTFAKQIGGAVRNYQQPDKAWGEIVNDFEIEGDSVVYVDKAVLRARVNKGNGVSTVFLTWGGQEYTVTQKPVGIGWLKISTRQSQWIDSTMNWGNFSVDSNICKWTGISPAVDYRVLKGNGRVAHGIFYKPAFLDSAVILYNQRPDSLDIALANVMVYTLSSNIDDADSAIGDVPKRRLKDFGYYSFNLGKQRLRFPGCDTLPKIPVRQYWEERGTKIVCIEYVMMSKVKKVHEAYPSATIWHNDIKTIEGTTNVEDAAINSVYPDKNYGGGWTFRVYTSSSGLIRVKNVASELGVGATISAAVCSLYCGTNSADGDVMASSVFKPWNEGALNGTDPVDAAEGEGVVTWNDWSNDDEEWTTEGCLCANDDGVDNSVDDGACDASGNRDRKATAEDTENVTTASTWYAWNMTAALAQAWYDGTKNEEGIVLVKGATGDNDFNSTENPSNKPFWVFTFTNNTSVFTGTSHVMDSWMNLGLSSGVNYGTETYITFHNNFGTELRPILKVINITDSITEPIVACTLRLWQSQGGSGYTGTLYAVKKDTWTEDGVCGDDWKVDYQWQTVGADSASDDPGCNAGDGTGADRTATAVGSVTTPSSGNWVSIGIDVDLANDWLDETECESGIVIAVAEGANNLRFHSSEGDSVPQWIFIWGEEAAAAGQVITIQQ